MGESQELNNTQQTYLETESPTQLTGILLSPGNSNGITDQISGHVGVDLPSAPNGQTSELGDLRNDHC